MNTSELISYSHIKISVLNQSEYLSILIYKYKLLNQVNTFPYSYIKDKCTEAKWTHFALPIDKVMNQVNTYSQLVSKDKCDKQVNTFSYSYINISILNQVNTFTYSYIKISVLNQVNTFLLLIYKDKCTESSEHITLTHI